MATSRRLFIDSTTVGNGAVATEETLHTFTLPAGTLIADNDAIEIRTELRLAANGNGKRIRLHFGGTTVGDSTSGAFNDVGVVAVCRIVRTSATTQKSICSGFLASFAASWGTAAGGGFDLTTPAETLSGTVLITVTGTAAGSIANEIQAVLTTIDYHPAP